MTALVRILVAVIATWLSVAGSSAGAQDLPGPGSRVNAYTYEATFVPTDGGNTHYDRGPPTVTNDAHQQTAAGRGSSGASARPRTARSLTYTAYDRSAPLVQVDVVGGMAETERAVVAQGDLRAVSGLMVAAKSADEVAEVAANAPKITFGHGARHLEGTGLGVEEVESTILQRVTTAAAQATSETGSFWGRVQIRGTTIEYRAYTLSDGTINVGTYYYVP